MQKLVTRYQCETCKSVHSRWQGQCPQCNAWNTLKEIQMPKKATKVISATSVQHKPVSLSDLSYVPEDFIPSGIGELDRVLGKGFVKGSIVLLGGEPGIGKSTLAMQFAQSVASSGYKVLVITGEESLNQVLLRANRLGESSDSLKVLSEINIQSIINCIEEERPDLVVLDSIQVVYHPDLGTVSGTVNQVRYCASELIQTLKSRDITGVFIGHITKEGSLAGPKVLEHLVDVILYMEGERNQQYRLLRSFKNRYASTHELGIFDMKAEGLIGIPNPSHLFLDESTMAHPGSMVAAICEGSRAILVEVQALVVSSGYGMAKRTFLGVDSNRANVMIATIEKILGITMSDKDVILNVVGGMKVTEPSLDLAMVLAMVSSIYDKPMFCRMLAVGELGLTGEVRGVSHMDNRVHAAEKRGFDLLIAPKKSAVTKGTGDMAITQVSTLQEALAVFMDQHG